MPERSDEPALGGALWEQAVEARLAGDRARLVRIALDLACPAELLLRLGLGSDEAVTAAVLLRPEAPVEVVEHAAASGRTPLLILAALHPRASIELLGDLARTDRLSVGFAVLLNPRTPRAVLDALAAKHPKIAAFRAVLDAAPRGWAAIAEAAGLDLDALVAASRGTHELLLDADTPIELLTRHARRTPAVIRDLVESPRVQQAPGELLGALDLRRLPAARLADLASLEHLTPAWLEALVERALAARPSRDAVRRPSGQRAFTPGSRLTLLGRLASHPAWARADLGALTGTAVLHPKLWLTFLDSPALSVEAKAALRRAEPKPLGKTPKARAKRRSKDPLEGCPRAVRLGLATRPDLPPELVEALTRAAASSAGTGAKTALERSSGAHLAAGGHLPAEALEGLLDPPVPDEQAYRRGAPVLEEPAALVARAPNLPAALVPRLLEHRSAAVLTALAQRPELDPKTLLELAAEATHPSRADPSRGLEALRRARLCDEAGLLLAAHPRLDVAGAELVLAVCPGALEVILGRTELPLERRRAWADAAADPEVARLALPEARGDAGARGVIDARLRAIDRQPFSRAAALLRSPLLTADQLATIARHIPADRYEAFEAVRLVALYPAVTPELLLELARRATPRKPGPHFAAPSPWAALLARSPRATGAVLEALAGDVDPLGPTALEALAQHPATPRSIVLRLLAEDTPRVQRPAAAHPSLSPSEVIEAIGAIAKRRAELEASVDAACLLAGSSGVGHEIEALIGQPVLRGDALWAAVEAAPVSATAGGDWAVDLLTHGGGAGERWTRLARRLCALEDELGREARRVAAARARDPALLEAIAAARIDLETSELLDANPALPPGAKSRAHPRPRRGPLPPPPPGGEVDRLAEALLDVLAEKPRWQHGYVRVHGPLSPESDPRYGPILAALLLFRAVAVRGNADRLELPGLALLTRTFGHRYVAFALASARYPDAEEALLVAASTLDRGPRDRGR